MVSIDVLIEDTQVQQILTCSGYGGSALTQNKVKS